MKGKLGRDFDVSQGAEAAKLVALSILASIKAELGSLNGIKSVVKTLGLVNCVPEFEEQPKVMNGASDLFVQIWGETNGKGVRSALGTNSLPFNFPVEIEMIFELHRDVCGEGGCSTLRGCC